MPSRSSAKRLRTRTPVVNLRLAFQTGLSGSFPILLRSSLQTIVCVPPFGSPLSHTRAHTDITHTHNTGNPMCVLTSTASVFLCCVCVCEACGRCQHRCVCVCVCVCRHPPQALLSSLFQKDIYPLHALTETRILKHTHSRTHTCSALDLEQAKCTDIDCHIGVEHPDKFRYVSSLQRQSIQTRTLKSILNIISESDYNNNKKNEIFSYAKPE
jgi:hypothetical protein